jgi:cyclic beta-1,2-glucan synthetase
VPTAAGEEQEKALSSALSLLYDRERGLVKLFDPPFGDGTEEPGYVKSYGPGFRENGGQYTHGAIWLASAFLRAGRTAEGYDLLRTLLPRGDTDYAAEPFVLSADVWTNPDRYGEAGWSWYTGSAGWYFRAAAEDLLGLRLQDGKLTAAPGLPEGWEGFEAVWTDGTGRKQTINVRKNRQFWMNPEIHK